MLGNRRAKLLSAPFWELIELSLSSQASMWCAGLRLHHNSTKAKKSGRFSSCFRLFRSFISLKIDFIGTFSAQESHGIALDCAAFASF